MYSDVSNLIDQNKRRCWRCKRVLPLNADNFYRNKNEIGGFNYICKQCAREYRREGYRKNKEREKENQRQYYKKNREYLMRYSKKYRKTVRGIYFSYKGDAKRRNLKWDLSVEDFEKIISKPCYYCGSKNGKYSGVDRIDNSVGYIKGNCVPCCRKCNMMKKDMSKDEFISQCRKIADNFNE